MKTQLNPSGEYRIPNVTTFLDILSHPKISFMPAALYTLLERFLNLKGGSIA